jgi:purine-binding chemotaxis protein CheW
MAIEAAQELVDIKLACFMVNEQHYAVDIMKIKQIIRPLKITPLPQAPSFVEGVINLRGVVIPVMDMRKRFGIMQSAAGEAKVIIVGVERHIVGIIVDNVTEVINIPRSQIQPPPKLVKGLQSDYILGVCRYKDDILLILNLDQLLTSDEKISLVDLKDQK